VLECGPRLPIAGITHDNLRAVAPRIVLNDAAGDLQGAIARAADVDRDGSDRRQANVGQEAVPLVEIANAAAATVWNRWPEPGEVWGVHVRLLSLASIRPDTRTRRLCARFEGRWIVLRA
jgi:hypothetical protein